jgi:hypothetical protein
MFIQMCNKLGIILDKLAHVNRVEARSYLDILDREFCEFLDLGA